MLLNIAADMANDRFAGIATFVAALLAGLMANGALLRLAFADEHPGDGEFKIGPQGFQFGQPELRLLGAILLLALFGLIAFLFMLLLVIIFTLAMLVTVHGQTALGPATKLPPDVQEMVAGLVLIFALAMLWLALRVCLYPAATIAQKRIQVFSTWAMTAGSWWRIFAACLVLLIPAFALALLLGLTSSIPALQAGVAVLSAGVNAFVEVPLFCGLYAHLYKQLRGGAPAYTAPTAVAPPRAGLAGPWG